MAQDRIASSTATQEIEQAYQGEVAQRTELEQAAVDHLWMHVTQWNDIAKPGGVRALAKGEGIRVTDIHGKEYIDSISGIWVVNAGHGRKEIGDAYAEQVAKIAYSSAIGVTNEPAIKLSAKIAQLTPGDLSRVLFVSGGSEAVESAVKIAMQYQALSGFPKRYKIVARRNSYHGGTFTAMSLTGDRSKEMYFGPYLHGARHVSPPYCYRCDFKLEYPSCNMMCVTATEQMIQWENPETIAAIIAEPISVACNVAVPPKEYWTGLREIADKYGIVLIADEVINGYGRTGKMFAMEHFGVTPDIMTMAKGLSSGYAPIAAAVSREAIHQKFIGDGKAAFAHIITFGGHAGAAAAALKNLEIFERENLVQNAAEVGAYLGDGLNQLRKHKIVGDVRGIGMLWALEFVKDKNTKEKFTAADGMPNIMLDHMNKLGMIGRVTTDVMHIAPPLVLTKSEADEIVGIVDRTISAVEKDLGF